MNDFKPQNQILEVDIIDVETGAHREARIRLKGGLSHQHLARARADLARSQVF